MLINFREILSLKIRRGQTQGKLQSARIFPRILFDTGQARVYQSRKLATYVKRVHESGSFVFFRHDSEWLYLPLTQTVLCQEMCVYY